MKKGDKFSEEHKLKLSKAKLGKLNPRYGKTTKNKGSKISEETRIKIKEKRKLQVVTEEHKKNISKSMIGKFSGEKSYNWKGGITQEILKIRQSVEIKYWRLSVFERDNWTCQECGIRGGILQAHHIKPFAYFPELRTSIENGVTLCKQCHSKVEKWIIIKK